MALVISKIETKQNLKKGNSDQNRGNLAKVELGSQILTCSIFTWSQLVVICSITLTGLPRAGANSELHHYKQKYKNEGPTENMGFT